LHVYICNTIEFLFLGVQEKTIPTSKKEEKNNTNTHVSMLLQIQLKSLAEEMQAVNKGLEKVEQELSMSESDGPVSDTFRKVLFICIFSLIPKSYNHASYMLMPI
jgi:hypothetical protein